MKQVILLIILFTGTSFTFGQSHCDTVFKQGDLFLQKNLSAELQLVASQVNEEQQSHAHNEWTYYLNQAHPSVATVRKYFAQAAKEFGVPQILLEAIGQVENNWTQMGPSIDQGWGIMHLVENNYCHTLPEASALLGISEQTLKDDAKQNIRGAAALLQKYYGQKRTPSARVEDWYAAAKQFSGLISEELRTLQADRYYTVLNDGNTSHTLWGETIVLEKGKQIDRAYIAKRFKNSTHQHKDLRSADYGPAVASFTTCNFASTRNHAIDTWVNHWIGTGTAAGAVSWFQNCSAQVSAHFVTANNGTIYQVVPVANTAWHCGVSGYPYNNGRSIGEEHEATVSNPSLWNSTAMLQASAQMACYFCGLYSIPTNQNHSSPGICGHQNMPGTNTDCPGTIPWATWFSYFNSGNCNAQPPAQPANDYCGNAVPLSVYTNTCGGAVSGNINGATQSATPTTCDGYASTQANDVWYTFVATAASHDITVVPSSGLDAVVDLRTACPGTTIDCEDTGGGEGATEILHATGLSIGTTYYVRVYDYTGANNPPTTSTFTICVTTPCSAPTQPIIQGTPAFCSGQSAPLTVSNPCSACSFSWSNGATGTSLTVTTSGNYSVTATNACGAIASVPFSVTVTPTPQPIISNLSNAYCTASSDVTLSLSPIGGTLSGSGINGNTFSPSAAGTGTHTITYTVTQNGCTGTATALTTISTSPSVHISGNGPVFFCEGEQVTLTATQGTSYLWSNGASSPSIQVNQSGTYDVTVANPGGCNANISADSAVVITVYPLPIASAGADQIFLVIPNNSLTIGGSPAAMGGSPPYSYHWAPAGGLDADTVANPIASHLTSPVTYTLTVTDSHGCVSSDSLFIQTTAVCHYTTAPNYFHFPATGVTDSFYVYVSDTACAAWNVTGCSWISLLTPSLPHTGNGWLVFLVQPNTDTLPRNCTIALTGGASILVVQDGLPPDPCNPPISAPGIQINFCDLAADFLPGVSYQWYVNGTSISGANSRFYSVSQSGYYYVLVADSNFCSAQSQDMYITYPGCNGNGLPAAESEQELRLFPNPNSGDRLSVEISDAYIPAAIKIIDATGRVVFLSSVTSRSFEIKTGSFSAGVYFVSFYKHGVAPITRTFLKY